MHWGIELAKDMDYRWTDVTMNDILRVSLLKSLAQLDKLSN